VTGFLGWVVGGILGTWLLLTVAAQIPPLRRKMVRHDVAGFLPNWNLFARPRVQDMVLLRRDILRDGSLTAWSELDVAPPIRWYNCVWNPGLGPRRALLALADRAARNARRQNSTLWRVPGQGSRSAIPDMLTVPYLGLLKYVSEQSETSVTATQFMVAAMDGLAVSGRLGDTGSGNVVLLSEFHQVPGSDDVRRNGFGEHLLDCDSV
jgi:hypothetical protein